MDSTGKEQQIKVRCNTCRGTGIAVAGEGKPMADQGNSTLLTAAKARVLAEDIKDSVASIAIHNVIPTIKRAAEEGRLFVEVSGGIWSQGDTTPFFAAVQMLKALGYQVSFVKRSAGEGLRISW